VTTTNIRRLSHEHNEVRRGTAGGTARAGDVEMALEVVAIPVSDVDRSTPGSECSIQFGTNVTSATPGSATNVYLIVADVQAARDALAARGVTVSEVFHEQSLGDRFHADDRVAGAAPEHATYGSFASFSDPDGNSWLLQEITTRLPGRIDSGLTAFAAGEALATAMRRASIAHGEHEKRAGAPDEHWPDWYAAYMVAEQAGTELPT
jgi:hypothetical protein